MTDYVYLVDVDTNTTCLHSKLPVKMKESHAFECNDTLLVCSSYTEEDVKNLQCFNWNGTGWNNFTTPESNGVYSFIDAVKMPGVGIWFPTIFKASGSSVWGSASLLFVMLYFIFIRQFYYCILKQKFSKKTLLVSI